jgi:hypothetical protein
VDIRLSEYRAEQGSLIWCPDFLISCTLISWSPDTRLYEVEQLTDFKSPTRKKASDMKKEEK